ncbi:MAG: YdiU family protein [Methylococcales bacterium]|nr:YdiU family protein [Methylococcales bacterium]
MTPFECLKFDNIFSELGNTYYSTTFPEACNAPYIVSVNRNTASLIDLKQSAFGHTDFKKYFSGNKTFDKINPLAMLYSGHQFGHYVEQLGDGRALLLGQVRNSNNELWDIQLKGAGVTPYSRGGDGRAVLRSTIREYLCSEAMHGLDIATTRALCIVGTDDHVYRESIESGAILTRLAPSHLRFGSFEVFFYRRQFEAIKPLADYAIKYFFPELLHTTQTYLDWLKIVIERTAKLFAQWQSVGFSHGVLNTDNMSILGLTMDYGPFGFMDHYDPSHICNHSDHTGRYAFDQQPQIGLWNLSCFAQAILPILDEDPNVAANLAKDALTGYWSIYQKTYTGLIRKKLGFYCDQNEDATLIDDLFKIMADQSMDFTQTFRTLSMLTELDACIPIFLKNIPFTQWLTRYQNRLKKDIDVNRHEKMNQTNPKYVLRNHLAQQAIEKAQNKDFTEVDRILKLLQTPYDEQPDMQQYSQPANESASSVIVSCSS